MNCVRCGLAAGYNRAVVDVASGVLLGGLCVDCERSGFGESLERGFWAGTEGCGLCPRDGHFALPLWEPRTEERDGDVYCSVDYRVTDETLLVCDEHLHVLCGDLEREPGRQARP